MFLLVAALFGILYGAMVIIGQRTGIGNSVTYLVMAFAFMGLQYLISPFLVSLTMRIRWVTEAEEPELHRMVSDLAAQAHLPKPKVGVSEMDMPNAFAFGRTPGDGRVCVTRGILRLLNKDELRAVIGHEMSHVKHRDMIVMTLLSAVPMVLYWIAFSFMWGGFGGNNNRKGEGNGSYTALIGIGAFLLYFLTNLLVLYGSRIREYYADQGSVQLGNKPNQLATALYKLAYGNARQKNPAELKRVAAVKAFFVSDPTRSLTEIRELKELDRDMNGVIDQDELMALRQKTVRLSTGDKLMELFTTHPNMVKRIKHLSTLV
ncbi:MAG: M48 family metalloprotease [Dehalococcoidales bacterium]|nr:M48 family metalloprotease [Dehalococcoidales bacterium]